MKKTILLGLFLGSFNIISAQKVLDRILIQCKFPFNSTTWVDASEEKFYYNTSNLVACKVETSLINNQKTLTEIDTNNYNASNKLEYISKYFFDANSKKYNKIGTEVFTYTDSLLIQKVSTSYGREEVENFRYHINGSLKEKEVLKKGSSTKFKTSYSYNNKNQVVRIVKTSGKGSGILNISKDTFVYENNVLKKSIHFAKGKTTNDWDTVFVLKYNYADNGTLKEKVRLAKTGEGLVDDFRHLYYYKRPSYNTKEK